MYVFKSTLINTRLKSTIQPLLLFLYLLPLAANADKLVTAVAVAGHWQPSATAFARVVARQQVVLSLPFAARITRLNVVPGEKVAAGTVLAQFDAPLLRQHLASWKQSLLVVRLAQKRMRVLRESEAQHTITRSERLSGEQAVAQAQGKAHLDWETVAADLDLLHIKMHQKALAKQINKTDVATIVKQLGRLKAPFTGIIVKSRATLGQQLAAASPVYELEALQQVYLDVGVAEAALTFWQNGETRRYSVLTHLAATHGSAMSKNTTSTTDGLQPTGGVPLYDASTGLWLLRFKSDNPGLMLRDGRWVEVTHFAAPVAVVWVPAAAVVSRQRKAWVMVVHNNQYKAVAVHVGGIVDGRVALLSGLSAGDKVVTKGAYELLYHDLKKLIKFVD